MIGRHLLALLFLAAQSRGNAETEARMARLDVAAVTATGEKIESGRIELNEEGTSMLFRLELKQVHDVDIPYGTYTLKLVVPGFKWHLQPLQIYQPQVSARILVSVSSSTPEKPLRVTGSIAQSMSPRNPYLWVKLVPVLLAGAPMDSRVQPDGTFMFTGFEPGDYVVMVVRENDVIYPKQFRLVGGEELRVSLSQKSQTLIGPGRRR